MWLLVFFDLPVGTKPQRRAASRFRHFLLDDGYMMLQYSVYARICRAEGGVDKHLRRVANNLPDTGSIRALQITDRQYERTRILLGTVKPTEQAGAGQMLLL